MPFSPDLIESPHRLRVRTDNKILVIASGIAVFNFQGTSADPGGWRRDDIVITAVDNLDFQVERIVPTVSLASISNLGTAVNAGWAVDDVRAEVSGSNVVLRSRLAVRDTDGIIHRVAFHVSVLSQRQ